VKLVFTENKQGKNHYFITFIDDYSRFTMLYFLKLKSEAFKAFLSFKSLAENTTQNTVICIRTDNDGEYLSNEWKNYCNENGIRHEFTTPYTPHNNTKHLHTINAYSSNKSRWRRNGELGWRSL
jgi:transposase InsO family protein